MSTDVTGQPVDHESLEEAIAQIKGVLDCQVVVDDQGGVQAIHAIGDLRRSAKQVVRDVESLLRVRFGRPIDYRKISLVQLDEATARMRFCRLRLLSISSNLADDGSVSVELEQNGLKVVGFSSGGSSTLDRMEHAARATVHAVSQLIGEGAVSLEDAGLVTLGRRELVAVSLVARFSASDERLVGIASIRTNGQILDAVVNAASRATLAALNRRLPLFVPSKKVAGPAT